MNAPRGKNQVGRVYSIHPLAKLSYFSSGRFSDSSDMSHAWEKDSTINGEGS